MNNIQTFNKVIYLHLRQSIKKKTNLFLFFYSEVRGGNSIVGRFSHRGKLCTDFVYWGKFYAGVFFSHKE